MPRRREFRDHLTAIGHQHAFTRLGLPNVLAQSVLELPYANGLHGLNVAPCSHIFKQPLVLSGAQTSQLSPSVIATHVPSAAGDVRSQADEVKSASGQILLEEREGSRRQIGHGGSTPERASRATALNCLDYELAASGQRPHDGGAISPTDSELCSVRQCQTLVARAQWLHRANRALLVTELNTHGNEMYGTIAVYLRLKGIVPPTTARQKPAPARGN